MKRLAIVLGLLLLATPVQAQVQCTISETLGCFGGSGGGVAVGDDSTWTGANIFTGKVTFGTAADAANSARFNDVTGCLAFEGATAGNFETSICVTDPTADTTFTLPPWSVDFDGIAGTANVVLGAAAGQSLVAGADQNVLIGISAGSGINNGVQDANTFIGYQAGMLAHTSATQVTCVGALACDALSTGSGTYVGYNAGTAITTGGQNAAFGLGAGGTTTTGNYNSLFGYSAVTKEVDTASGTALGHSAIVGDSAVAIGAGAEAYAGSISIGAGAGDAAAAVDVNNVFIGDQAGGVASGTSTDNTCVGDIACSTLTSGDSNVCVGQSSCAGLTTGGSNIIIGPSTTAAATSAQNVVIGEGSIAYGSTGVAIGYGADAVDGVSIGYQAGDSAGATEVDNVFIGTSAGTAASGTSTDNTCVGDLACDSLTTGDNNVFIGADSDGGAALSGNVVVGQGATSAGASDVAIGLTASATANYATAVGALSIAGSTGTAIGRNAETIDGVSVGSLAGDAQAAGDVDNVFIGNSAGTAASGTSTDNTCIGDLACGALTTGDRNTLFGANADVGTVTDSDVTVIGESMVGKASDSILIGFGGQEHYYTHGAGKDLVAGGADEVFALSIATITGTSATVSWNVVAYDAADAQSLAGMAVLWGINKADTEDCNMEELTAGTDEATSSGTLTAVPTWAAGTNECIFNLNAVSSLTETTLKAYYTVTINGPATTLTLK